MQANRISEITSKFPILGPVLQPLVERAEAEAAEARAARRAELERRKVALERARLKEVERHAAALRQAEAHWRAVKAQLDEADKVWARAYAENTSARLVYDREAGAVRRELEETAHPTIDAFIAETWNIWAANSTVRADTVPGLNGPITKWTNGAHIRALSDALGKARLAAEELRYVADDKVVERELAKLRAGIPAVPTTEAEAEGSALAAA